MKTFIGAIVATKFYSRPNYRGVVLTNPVTTHYGDNTKETTVIVMSENGKREKVEVELLSPFEKSDQFYKMPIQKKLTMKGKVNQVLQDLEYKTKREVKFYNPEHGEIIHILEGSIIEINAAAKALADIYNVTCYSVKGL